MVKKTFTIIVILTFCCICAESFATWTGETVFDYNFNSVTFSNSYNNIPSNPSTICENGLVYSASAVQANQLEFVGAKYKIFEKNRQDGVFAVGFNPVNGKTADPYTNIQLTGNYSKNNVIKQNQLIKISLEVAANNKSNSMSMRIKGLSSDNAPIAMAYEPLYPQPKPKESISRNSILQKYDGWFYFGLFSVDSKEFAENHWYKYDACIDTSDGEYDNKQTIAFYLDGILISKGILDANGETAGIDTIKSIEQTELYLQPTYVKNAADGLYSSSATSCYIDNFMINILGEQNSSVPIAYYINNEIINGKYSIGNISIKAKGEIIKENPMSVLIACKYDEKNRLERIVKSDMQVKVGEICINDKVLTDKGYIKLMLLSDFVGIKPLTAAQCIYPQTNIVREQNSVVMRPETSFTTRTGVYGKNHLEKSIVFMSNTEGCVALDTLPCNIDSKNSIQLTFSIAGADGNSNKTLKVNGTEMIKIAHDGGVTVMNHATLAKAEKNRWEKFDVVIQLGSYQVYMNGIKIYSGVVPVFNTLAEVQLCFSDMAYETVVALDDISLKVISNNASIIDDTEMLTYAGFDYLKANDVYDAKNISYVNYNVLNNVFSYQPTGGKFGKTADDIALCISNNEQTLNSDNANMEWQGIDFSTGLNNIASGDNLHISFEYAQDFSHTQKSLIGEAYVDNDGGKSMLNILDINPDGTISFFNDLCFVDNKPFYINKKQWYKFDIVFNSVAHSDINSFSAYINGIPVVRDYTFCIDGSVKNKINGFSTLKMVYDVTNIPLSTQDSKNRLMAEGFYIDNIKCVIRRNGKVNINQFDLITNDAIYNLITSNRNFTIDNYGQDTQRFINSIVPLVKNAQFVSNTGSELSSIEGKDTYFRLLLKDDNYIYYAMPQGENNLIKGTVNEPEEANPITTDWYEYKFPDVNKLINSPLDVSCVLETRAGAKGFIKAEGEDFVFEDKTKIKFWGCNLIGTACFPDEAQAVAMADTIASQGFNIVRFHQISGKALPNIFGDNTSGKQLDVAQMRKLCFFMKQLRERGIYYFIDQGREVYPDDNLADMPPNVKLVSYFDQDIKNLQLDYSKQLLTYIDPYTQNRICDDPALMGIGLINECTLFTADLTTSTYYYNKINTLFNDWLKTKYKSRTDLANSWKNSLFANENQFNNSVKVLHPSDRAVLNVNRNVDTMKFFAHIQKSYFEYMTKNLRSAGVKSLITGCTSWGMLEPPIIYSNMQTDFVDYHAYWTHPNGYTLDAGVVQDSNSSVKSMLLDKDMGIIGNFMNRKIYNKPTTITEWNSCAGNLNMSEGPLLMAAYSKMQNWNPMMFLFSGTSFSNIPQNSKIDDVFMSINHPIRLASTPAATLLFKNVTEAQVYSYTDYVDEKIFNYDMSNQWANQFLLPNTPTVGFIGKIGISVGEVSSGNDANLIAKAKMDEAKGVFTSCTGELVFDKNNKIFTVDTAKSQAVTGFVKDKTIDLSNVTLKLNNEFATVYVNSLTNSSIIDSNKLLLTVAGRAWNSGHVVTRNGGVVLKTGENPILIEPILGEVTLKINKNVRVYALSSSGEKQAEIQTYLTSDGYVKFNLTKDAKTMNYMILEE